MPKSPASSFKTVPPIERRMDFYAIRQFVHFYGRAFQQRRILAPCPLPAIGPAIIAANHTAGLDPIVIQSTSHRPITWIMTAEFYDQPGLKWFLQYARMIRVDRGTRDPGAWREAIKVLKEGRVVGVFPEGRIERTGELLPFETGVALLASRAGADLYPLYIDGLQRNTPMLQTFLQPQHSSIAWGEPICVASEGNDRGRLQRITTELQRRVEELKARHPSPRHKGRSMLCA